MPISSTTLKKILLFGSPILIATFAGVYYYIKKNSLEKKVDSFSRDGLKEESPQLAAIALKNRGNRFFKVGKYDKAIECYTEALEQCPLDSVEDRATFYQNRAAARENLGQIESAIADCNSSLELSPSYIKALNRRARLYEKNQNLEDSLRDITACCLLERFKNNDNVETMDRVLKKIAKKLVKEEPPKSRRLPSPDFIKFYLSSWSCDVFNSDAMKIHAKKPVLIEQGEKKEMGSEEQESVSEKKEPTLDGKVTHKEENELGAADSVENGSADKDETGNERKEEKLVEDAKLPSKLIQAYGGLEEAFEKMKTFEYEEAWKLVTTAVKNFNSSVNVDLHVFEKSALGDCEKPESARARALLLEATFKALVGESEEAKTRFLLIGETFFAHPSIRVNALIKAAALFMTVEQDVSGCMYTFQQAQTLDPLCADVYLHRGQTNLLLGNLDAADKDFAEAIRLKPNFSVAHAQRLYLNYRKAASEGRISDCEKTVKDFKVLIEKFPTCIESHSIYAQILNEVGDFDESDKEFGKIIEMSPHSGMAYAQRGMLHLRLKQDPEAAEKWIEKGLEADPHCELAWELRGQLATEKGEHIKAMEYFQKALDETRISSDRIHLFALREGVKAQLQAAKTYNLNLAELFAQVKQDLQEKMMQAMADGYGGLLKPQ